jgi:uncharacterized protein YndB with AHSA1/START domain
MSKPAAAAHAAGVAHAIPPVRQSVQVKAPIAHAFEVFTAGITRWWPSNSCNISRKPVARIVMEPRLGGRWLEIAEDGSETTVATILQWEPPGRVVLQWQVTARFEPDASMRSEVDVRFTAEGPDTTRVDLLHHKFETMGEPDGSTLRAQVGGGWPGMLERFVREAENSNKGACS